MLILAVLMGAVGMYATFEIEWLVITRWQFMETNTLARAAMAGGLEEGAKLLVVVCVAVCFKRQFNDPIDGLIYGSMAGLGAACYEGLLFISLQNADNASLELLGPEAVRLMMHTVWGAMAGFPLSMTLFDRDWRPWIANCYVLAAALHMSWDYLVGFVQQQTTVHNLIAAVILLVSVLFFAAFVVLGNRISHDIIDPENKRMIAGTQLTRYL